MLVESHINRNPHVQCSDLKREPVWKSAK
jgi:hypothetical protein